MPSIRKNNNLDAFANIYYGQYLGDLKLICDHFNVALRLPENTKRVSLCSRTTSYAVRSLGSISVNLFVDGEPLSTLKLAPNVGPHYVNIENDKILRT